MASINRPMRRRTGNLSSTTSLASIDSSVEGNNDKNNSQAPIVTSLRDCDDQLEKNQILLKTKMKEMTNFAEQLRLLRSNKEPLVKIKQALHEEIANSKEVINKKSEEATQLKHKLRHHSERQVQDNIERLEFQLRNNNYKPRGEQKILNEICMLKRSIKTLKEFELKQRENQKYRSERYRLIEERNDIFSKMQAILIQEDEVRRGMGELRELINLTKKANAHLRSLRPDFLKKHLEDFKLKEDLRQKRIEEKTRTRKELYRKNQEERHKRWEEYEASREPYEDEKDLCRLLIGYIEAYLPSNNDSTKTSLAKVLSSSDVKELNSNTSSDGVFYSKPKDEPPPNLSRRKSKKNKREKSIKVKDLSHSPDVLKDFSKLEIKIPKTTEDIPVALASLKSKLEYYGQLGKEKILADATAKDETAKIPETISATRSSGTTPTIGIQPSSNSVLITTGNSSSDISITTKVSAPKLIIVNSNNNIISSENPSPGIDCDGNNSPSIGGNSPSASSTSSSSGNSKSYFSLSPSIADETSCLDSTKVSCALTPTYASVTAKIGV